MKQDIKDSRLRAGIQQFRLMFARSRMGQFVTQDIAALIWLEVIGGEDVKLPPECERRIGEKRKRDEKA